MATSLSFAGPDTDAELEAFIDGVRKDVAHAAEVLTRTGTLVASSTGFILQRIPGQDRSVLANYPDPWTGNLPITVINFDGSGDPKLASVADTMAGFQQVFVTHPEITTIIHIHTPYLGAFAHSHTEYPLNYAAVARHTLSRSMPVLIDRRPNEGVLIIEHLKRDPHLRGVIEGNGGATLWGDGVIPTNKFILLAEEGAKCQVLAAALGGTRDFGPAVLDEQWARTGLR
jgi:L-ribulose-5-phosphate 4-epimerase